MTAARQQRKGRRAPIAVFALVLSLLAGASLGAAADGITERIVVDRHTGLAIDGYDPVAFYTDGKPVPGSPDFELQYGGAVWRFCNFGNRAAFAERPDVYMPKFGGYDPVGVARGVAVAGRPDVWLISGERLFLFYDSHRLETFAADPERYTSAAERKWPAVLQTLSP
jgi:YHS domain-containing protein